MFSRTFDVVVPEGRNEAWFSADVKLKRGHASRGVKGIHNVETYPGKCTGPALLIAGDVVT